MARSITALAHFVCELMNGEVVKPTMMMDTLPTMIASLSWYSICHAARHICGWCSVRVRAQYHCRRGLGAVNSAPGRRSIVEKVLVTLRDFDNLLADIIIWRSPCQHGRRFIVCPKARVLDHFSRPSKYRDDSDIPTEEPRSSALSTRIDRSGFTLPMI